MKKTRLLIALLVMLVAASGYAQDSYREAVKEYMAVNSKEALNNYWNRMDSVLKANNTYWFESGDVDLNQLTERYFKEGIMDYMTDFMCAKTKELGVTEAGLREYISLMSTPEGQTYKEHMAQWVEAIKRDTTVLNGQDSQDSLKIMAGEYPDPIQVKAGIDPGYVEKYKHRLEVFHDGVGVFAGLCTLFFHPIQVLEISMLVIVFLHIDAAQVKVQEFAIGLVGLKLGSIVKVFVSQIAVSEIQQENGHILGHPIFNLLTRLL